MDRPTEPFTTSAKLLIPTISKVKGVEQKVWPKYDDGIDFNCLFKTYGGTETTINNNYAVVDTANISTWYDPRITSECRIALSEDIQYDILGTPEDINLRHQFMKFKVQRRHGTA